MRTSGVGLEQVDAGWLRLGRLLAARRQAACMTQHELAGRVHFSRSTVANSEVGRRSSASLKFWQHCDEALGTGVELSSEAQRLDELRKSLTTPAVVVRAEKVASEPLVTVTVRIVEGGSIQLNVDLSAPDHPVAAEAAHSGAGAVVYSLDRASRMGRGTPA
ncbi:helix-turn-helix domain-containing protein [Actinoplanes philippinensis]|uniref:helix-turn-helix domain-containing protein n=1 Tax=Actinoplanes philippinensis TaxID=35752 RepID=UPI0033E69AC1